jgi:hypothetical protein
MTFEGMSLMLSGSWGAPSESVIVVQYMGEPPSTANITPFQYGVCISFFYYLLLFNITPFQYGVCIPFFYLLFNITPFQYGVCIPFIFLLFNITPFQYCVCISFYFYYLILLLFIMFPFTFII